MADMNYETMSPEEQDALAQQKQAAATKYQQSISTPQGYADAQAANAAHWNGIQTGAFGDSSQQESWFDHALSTFIDYIPVIYAAAVTAGAAGAFGEAGAAAGAGEGAAAGAGAAGAGEAGLAGGMLSTDLGASGGLGFMEGLGGAEAASGAAGAGLGSLGADGAMQQVIIHGTAPGLASGLTGGQLAAGAFGTAGLTNILGSNPQLPTTSPYTDQMPDMNQEVPPGNVVSVPGVRPPPASLTPNIPLILPTNIGGVGNIPNVTQGTNGTNGTTPTGLPSGLGSLLGAAGGLLGGINDYKNSKEDSEWWKGQLDTLMGMYKPGTPEAELMRQKMEARDAATGRRSQYGQRENELAASLADRRSQIMTSAGYQNMANAYRNRSSQDLNGLFGALGNTGTQSLLNSAGSYLGNLFGAQTAPTR